MVMMMKTIRKQRSLRRRLRRPKRKRESPSSKGTVCRFPSRFNVYKESLTTRQLCYSLTKISLLKIHDIRAALSTYFQCSCTLPCIAVISNRKAWLKVPATVGLELTFFGTYNHSKLHHTFINVAISSSRLQPIAYLLVGRHAGRSQRRRTMPTLVYYSTALGLR
jgi:hypothetical protein